MKMQNLDMTGCNIDKIEALFPQCVTEFKDENGILRKGVDFDKLKQELSSDVIDTDDERYQFTWPDKREANRLANIPTTMTLRPCREESVDFDNTENLYIEGDNLDVLKVLRETYLGKIKMIYIDPPYNTGNDFVYNDDFSKSKEEFEQSSGLFDEDGNQTVDAMRRNLESNGRFHTDWLNMMYPRLKVARDLLTDDGVIFISIDDSEEPNLKKVCDEIFGEQNFIDIYCWAKTETPENLSIKCRQVIEYVLCYQKIKNQDRFKGLQKFSSSSNGLLNQPNAMSTLAFPANKVVTKIPNGIIKAGMYGTSKYDVELLNDVEVKDGLFITPFRLRAKFKWQQSYLENEIEQGTIISIPTIKFSPAYDKTEYAPEVPTNFINSKVGVETNENAGEYQISLFGKKVFNFPKPISLIKYLLGFTDIPDERFIVMDFFSGSSTTAEAVMQMNLKRTSQIKFIMVQIPEDLYQTLASCKEQSQKEIIQNAINLCIQLKKPTNLCEVAKERIRRAGKKIKEENSDKEGIEKLDTGFRVLKLDSSNMEDVFYSPNEFNENSLNLVDNIKNGRTPEDLLFQVMLDLGIELSAKIDTLEFAGKKAFNVNDGFLMATFDTGVNEDTIKAIAKMKPVYFVMRDASAANDNVIDNFEQLFKAYSPDTVLRVI